MNYFSKFDINKDELNKLENFNSRDGFIIVSESDFNDMLDYFKQYEVYNNLIPILTDNNSNYWCLYINGFLKGMICYLSHDELSLEPKFKGISELIKAIDNNLDAYDYNELDTQVFDFPIKNDNLKIDERKIIIDKLKGELVSNKQEDVRQQLSYSIMALTSDNEIEANIYPFLDDDDMYIQERAIQMIGYHKYKPARNKLIELTKTAMMNGKSAAGKALKELNRAVNNI